MERISTVTCKCKDCKDRYPGCHSDCSSYIEYRGYLNEISERRKACHMRYELCRSDITRKVKF